MDWKSNSIPFWPFKALGSSTRSWDAAPSKSAMQNLILKICLIETLTNETKVPLQQWITTPIKDSSCHMVPMLICEAASLKPLNLTPWCPVSICPHQLFHCSPSPQINALKKSIRRFPHCLWITITTTKSAEKRYCYILINIHFDLLL